MRLCGSTPHAVTAAPVCQMLLTRVETLLLQRFYTVLAGQQRQKGRGKSFRTAMMALARRFTAGALQYRECRVDGPLEPQQLSRLFCPCLTSPRRQAMMAARRSTSFPSLALLANRLEAILLAENFVGFISTSLQAATDHTLIRQYCRSG